MPIAQCGGARCVNEFQDKTYGRNMRVFNPAANATRELETLRCAVCNTEVTRSRKTPLPDKKSGKVDNAEPKVDKGKQKK